jgi:hypothetical protein
MSGWSHSHVWPFFTSNGIKMDNLVENWNNNLNLRLGRTTRGKRSIFRWEGRRPDTNISIDDTVNHHDNHNHPLIHTINTIRHTTICQQWASNHSYPWVSWRFKLNRYTPCKGKNLTNTSYVWPLGSHVRQPSAKFLLGWNWVSAPGMKSWLLAIFWPDRHAGLPYSPSTKPLQSRKGQFDTVVTKLLDLMGPIKPNMRSVQLKAYPPGSKRRGP